MTLERTARSRLRSQSDDSVARWRITAATTTRAFRKRCREIDESIQVQKEAVLLKALLAVESSARPRLLRYMEWAMTAVAWLPSTVIRPLRRRLDRMTLGPLQVACAGVRFDDQVAVARQRIGQSLFDIEEVARSYHGAAGRQPGSAIGYADALRCALAQLRA